MQGWKKSASEKDSQAELFSFYLHNRWEDDLDQAEELNVLLKIIKFRNWLLNKREVEV